MFEHKAECTVIYGMLQKPFGVKMKFVRSQKNEEIDKESGEYERLYDGETYLLMEAMSRDSKLNVNGLRKFMDDLVASSTKMGLGKYCYLFEQNDSMRFWKELANECSISIVFDSENKQILMIGLEENVKEYQDKLLQIIKKTKSQHENEFVTCSVDANYLKQSLDKS